MPPSQQPRSPSRPEPGRRLLVIRHGQTTWNAEGRWQGWADAPLSPLGEQQALDAAAHLARLGLAAVHSSDLGRARRTAEIVASELGLGLVTVHADLRERHVGAFEGLIRSEIEARYPHCFHPDTGRLIEVPDGEEDAALVTRARRAVLTIAKGHRDGGSPLLVVAHGGIIRAFERSLGLEPPSITPNLGGRWFTVTGEQIAGGDPFLPVEPELVTTPTSE